MTQEQHRAGHREGRQYFRSRPHSIIGRDHRRNAMLAGVGNKEIYQAPTRIREQAIPAVPGSGTERSSGTSMTMSPLGLVSEWSPRFGGSDDDDDGAAGAVSAREPEGQSQ